MGQILILEGEDFSNSPNAINIAELPVVLDSLYGFYTGRGSTSDADGIITMPANMGDGANMSRIEGQDRSPIYFQGSTIFKGNVLRSASDEFTNAPGLEVNMNLDLTTGVSFTFMINRAVPGTASNNRVLLAIEPILLQFRSSAPSAANQLNIGGDNYDVGFGGMPSGANAITVVITNSAFKLYVDGALLSNTDISASSLPSSVVGMVIYGSNWNGASALLGDQTKQIQIHTKELSLGEIQEIHSVLPDLLL